MHAIEDAPLHWLEPITDVRESTLHNDAHGVIKVGAAHFFFDANVLDPTDFCTHCSMRTFALIRCLCLNPGKYSITWSTLPEKSNAWPEDPRPLGKTRFDRGDQLRSRSSFTCSLCWRFRMKHGRHFMLHVRADQFRWDSPPAFRL